MTTYYKWKSSSTEGYEPSAQALVQEKYFNHYASREMKLLLYRYNGEEW